LKTIGGPGELNSSQASKEIRAKFLEVRPVALSKMNNTNNVNKWPVWTYFSMAEIAVYHILQTSIDALFMLRKAYSSPVSI